MCTRPNCVKVERPLYEGSPVVFTSWQYVPCGKCPECRAKRRLQWVFRLEQESLVHDFNYFVTLTYAPEFLPHDESLYKPDFQDFMKRLRKRLGFPIKYFACGEYGDEGTERCHWHFIIFSDHKIDDSDIEKTWTYGFHRFSFFTSGRAAYVAKYSQKQLLAVYPDDREPPCCLCSQGLGDCFFTPAMRKYYRMNQVTEVFTLNHQRVQLPRRYYEKLFPLMERLQMADSNKERALQEQISKEKIFGILYGRAKDQRSFDKVFRTNQSHRSIF